MSISDRLHRVLERYRALLHDPAGPQVLPRRVRDYASCYDPATGGYHREAIPGGFDYGPVEVEVGMLWNSLTMLLRPRRILETGTHWGFSTCCIAAALEAIGADGTILTLDPEPRDHLWGGTELASRIEYVAKTSLAAAPELVHLRFDMLVLDSDHHYETAMGELAAFEPLLRDGGVILMHDSLYYDGVGRAVAQVRANPRFEVVTLDTPRTHGVPGARPPGATLIRKVRSGPPELHIDPRYIGEWVGNRLETPLLRMNIMPSQVRAQVP